MKSLTTILALILLVLAPASAEPVYRCHRNGKVEFTDKPDDESCQPIDLQVIEPDPAEAARLQEEMRQYAEQRKEQAQREAVARAEARAARAEARAAEAQRRLAEKERQQPAQNTYWPGYFPGPIYPPVHPRPPVAIPPPVPPPPRTPDYPYAPSQGTVGGR